MNAKYRFCMIVLFIIWVSWSWNQLLNLLLSSVKIFCKVSLILYSLPCVMSFILSNKYKVKSFFLGTQHRQVREDSIQAGMDSDSYNKEKRTEGTGRKVENWKAALLFVKLHLGEVLLYFISLMWMQCFTVDSQFIVIEVKLMQL